MADGIISDPKDRADCLIKLHDTQMAHLRQTRTLEFQINLALWTLLVLAGKFAYESDTLSRQWVWVVGLGIVLVLGHLFLWMRPIQKSEDTDNYFIMLYRCEVERLGGVTFSEKPSKPRRGDNWIKFEVGITALLVIGICGALALK